MRAALAATAAASLLVAAATPVAAAVPQNPFPEFYGVSPATKLSTAETEQIGSSGAGTIRTPFYWPSIEPDPPAGGGVLPLPGPAPESKQFEATDEVVGNAAEAGLRVLPFVYGTPDWIASDPSRPPLDSTDARASWQDLLTDLVARYGPKGSFWSENRNVPKTPITAWQIANEPNSELYWSPSPSPAEYAELLQLSSTAIRSADPGAAIVFAGMFGTPASGIAAWDFLEGVYQVQGSADSFDAFALHPYAPNLGGIEAQVDLARDVVRSHGDRKLPLLISEIGWPTDGPAGYNLVKSQGAQKRLLAKAFRLFLDERKHWNIERVIWYTWRDNEVQPNCAVCRFSGLFTSDLQPKPAWRKFTQFAGGTP